MRIDKKTRARLLEDYSTASRNLTWVVEHGQNGLIAVPDYVTPVVRPIDTPLKSKKGEYQYYSALKGIIQAALAGKPPRIRAPCKLPKYLSDLLK